MPDGKLEEKLQKLKISESCNAIMDPLLNDEIIHLKHQTNDGKSYVSFAFTVCFVSGVSTENACHEHSHSTSVFWGRTESNTHTHTQKLKIVLTAIRPASFTMPGLRLYVPTSTHWRLPVIPTGRTTDSTLKELTPNTQTKISRQQKINITWNHRTDKVSLQYLKISGGRNRSLLEIHVAEVFPHDCREHD